MKHYPYSDSTDVIIYTEPERKKKKGTPTWLVAVCSAAMASVFTAGLMMGAMTLMNRPNRQFEERTNGVVYSTREENKENDAAETLAKKKEGEVLTVPEIATKVGPSVVGVINKTEMQIQPFWNPFSGQYYYSQDPSQDGELIEQGSGSGIIITADGYIVTNQHVIDGATEVEIVLNTGKTYTAKIVGEDAKTDLAVLKITPDKNEKLTAAVLGNSAVNRTMSIENRTYNLIQTDAAINNGNSGGALINQYGEVIGINSVKLSTTGVEGMGFAIAISEAKPIIDDLMNSGHVTGRPYVGIGITETRYGLFISSIQKGSGAEKAGLKVDDMILEVDGQEVSSTSEINEIRDKKKPGDKLTFKILRERDTMEVSVELTEENN